MNRRKFLQAGLVSSFFIGNASVLRGSSSGRSRAGKARNVIFLVSDGMSSGTLGFVDQFIRWRDGRPSNWIRLYEEEKLKRGLMETASANSIVTDSAAAAAAWGCGYRVNNGSVNIGPGGEHHRTILQLAKAEGKATGLITTATATHATPAGFAANVSSRGQEPLIAEQYFDRRLDLILGGGRNHFVADRREDGRDLWQEFKEAGYDCVANRKELRAVRGNQAPVLGLFADGHLPYELDRLNNEEDRDGIPSLAEMTRIGLEKLNRRAEGFVVQIEGARVDHGAHSNDIAALMHDQIAFDDAIAVATEFAENHGDTLVLITTDHGNANPGLNSGGDGGQRSFGILSDFRATQSAILSRVDRETSLDVVVEAIHEVTGLEIPRAEVRFLRDWYRGQYRVPYGRMNRPTAILGQILANHIDIGWVGNAHTSDHVELAAMGPGSEHLKPFQKNTDLFTLMVESLGIGARG